VTDIEGAEKTTLQMMSNRRKPFPDNPGLPVLTGYCSTCDTALPALLFVPFPLPDGFSFALSPVMYHQGSYPGSKPAILTIQHTIGTPDENYTDTRCGRASRNGNHTACRQLHAIRGR
jgi:hypothetical protein